MRLSALLFLIWFSISSTSLFAVGRFSVAPGIIHFDLTRPKTEVFAVMNVGDERMRIVMQPIYFPVESRFLSRGKPLVKGQPVRDDLVPYMVVSPKVISLKPGERRSIRIAIQGLKTTEAGDYRGHILVRQLGKPKHATPKKVEKGLKVQVRIRQETGIAIYARQGKPDTKLQMRCQKNAKNELEIIVLNNSNFLYMGWMDFEDTAGKAKPIRIRLQSYRETKRAYRLKAPFPKEMKITWGVSETALDEGSFICKVP